MDAKTFTRISCIGGKENTQVFGDWWAQRLIFIGIWGPRVPPCFLVGGKRSLASGLAYCESTWWAPWASMDVISLILQYIIGRDRLGSWQNTHIGSWTCEVRDLIEREAWGHSGGAVS